MANALGGMIVRLGLDATDFISGLTKSERAAQRFAGSFSNQVAFGVGKAIIALKALDEAVAFAIRAFPELIEQAGNFQDLAEKTGASAEALASFAISAKVAGTDMEAIAQASIKLSKSMAAVDDESKAAGAALVALGIPIAEFKKLDPAAQFERLAKAQATFAGGIGKTAAFEALMKGGAQLLPFFKELETVGGRQVILTQKQIEQADDYADKQKRLTGTLNAYAQVVAIGMLPALNSLTKATVELVGEMLGIDSVSKTLKNENAIGAFAESAALKVAFLVDALTGVVTVASTVKLAFETMERAGAKFVQGKFAEAKAIREAGAAEIDVLLQRRGLVSRLEDEFAKQKANANANLADQFAGGNKPRGKPLVPFKGAADKSAGNEAESLARRILDGQIKALEASVARERDILQARESFLRDSFTDGLLSVENYYSQLQAARDANLQHAISVLDQEIAKRKAFAATLTKASDREGEQNKIADLLEKQEGLIRNARFSEEALARDRERSTAQYLDQLSELNAKMLDLAGNTAKAAAIRFDVQNRGLDSLLRASGNEGARAQVQAIREQEQVQKQLNDESKKYQLIIEQGSIAQERINIARESGAIGELEALARTSAANRALLPLMQARIDALAEIAAKSQDPADLLKVEQLRVAMERLGAQTDLVKDKFNNIFSGALSDALSQLLDRTKSLKDATRDLVKSITGQINRIATDTIAGQVFGKGGALSGIGGIFSKLFGGDGAAGGATAAASAAALSGSAASLTASGATLTAAGATVTASGATLAASGGVLTAAGAALTAAAGALTASAAASAASGFADIFGSALGGLAQGGGLAGGTNFARGGMTLVGERGPELVNLPRGAQVIPNDVLMAKRDQRNVTINQSINVMPGATTASAMQAANMAGQQARRAVVRNG